MSAGMRDRDLAFESSEAGLRNGERIIDSLTAAPSPCTSGRCEVYDRTILPASMAFQTPTWWDYNAWSYVTDETFNTTQHTASSGGLISGSGMTGADPQFVARAGGSGRRFERAADRPAAEPHLLPHHIGRARRHAAGTGRAPVDLRPQILRTHMKIIVAARLFGLLLALAWPALHALAAGSPAARRPPDADHYDLHPDRSRPEYQFNPALVQCFDFRGDALTCDTLVGIGYVDRARVTLRGTDVIRIDIVELQQ